MADWIMCRCPRCDTTFELQTRAEGEPVGGEPTLFVAEDGVIITCPQCSYQEQH